MKENNDLSNFAERWSSAVQGGIGTQIKLSERLDFSLTGPYMMHLGNHLHPEFSGNQVFFHTEKGANLEGHLLTTLSINYKIGTMVKFCFLIFIFVSFKDFPQEFPSYEPNWGCRNRPIETPLYFTPRLFKASALGI